MRTSQLPQKIGDGVSQPEHCGVQWLFLLQAVSPHEAKAEAGTVVTVVAAERETVSMAMIQTILFIGLFRSLTCCGGSSHSEPPPAAFAGAQRTEATIARSQGVVKSSTIQRTGGNAADASLSLDPTLGGFSGRGASSSGGVARCPARSAARPGIAVRPARRRYHQPRPRGLTAADVP